MQVALEFSVVIAALLTAIYCLRPAAALGLNSEKKLPAFAVLAPTKFLAESARGVQQNQQALLRDTEDRVEHFVIGDRQAIGYRIDNSVSTNGGVETRLAAAHFFGESAGLGHYTNERVSDGLLLEWD